MDDPDRSLIYDWQMAIGRMEIELADIAAAKIQKAGADKLPWRDDKEQSIFARYAAGTNNLVEIRGALFHYLLSRPHNQE